MQSPTECICCCIQLKDTQKFTASLLLQLPRPEKQVCYLFYRCNGRIWISYLWFHLFLVLVTWSGRFGPISGSSFLCSNLFCRQCLGKAPACPALFCISRSPRTLQNKNKWKEWGRFGAAGRGRWLGKHCWSMDHPWEEQMEELSHENSVAGSGVIAKLPESSVAATTTETHRADLFLCWSSYKLLLLKPNKCCFKQVWFQWGA